MKRKRERANDIVRTSHYNTRSSSRNRMKILSDMIPMDIIIEIFKWLPAKSIARFLCLSKLWESILSSPYFFKLYLAVSSNQPVRLFFSFRRSSADFYFLSSLQTQNPRGAYVATYHPEYNKQVANSSFVHGLVCYKTASSSPELVVYNPTSRRSITLPKFEGKTRVMGHFLGFDPVGGVYKVLCMTIQMVGFPKVLDKESRPDPVFQVFTLGNGSSWKVVECSHVHFPRDSQICINGVIYYEAMSGRKGVVMSFDVRSERFGLIRRPDGAHSLPEGSIMVRYEGKPAITSRELFGDRFVLWVLEDSVIHEWLKMGFVLPKSWTSLAHVPRPRLSHRFVNVTDAGELVLAPKHLRASQLPYYVLCYDPERGSVRKAEIEGITVPSHWAVRCNEDRGFPLFHVFSSQVESLMFL